MNPLRTRYFAAHDGTKGQELEMMKRRLAQMEEEAQKLKEMQAQVEQEFTAANEEGWHNCADF